MKLGRSVALVHVLLVLLVGACAGELEDTSVFLSVAAAESSCFGGGTPEVLSSDKCASCHDGVSEVEGFGVLNDFSVPDLGARLTGEPGTCPTEPVVDPAKPLASTMVRWITRDVQELCRSGYTRMPPIGKVTQAQLTCIVQWIDGLDGVVDLEPAHYPVVR